MKTSTSDASAHEDRATRRLSITWTQFKSDLEFDEQRFVEQHADVADELTLPEPPQKTND